MTYIDGWDVRWTQRDGWERREYRNGVWTDWYPDDSMAAHEYDNDDE